MSGLTPDTPIPEELRLLPNERVLRVVYGEAEAYDLPFEYLRVFSPSAEVRGHGVGQEGLQVGKRNVLINSADLVGQYAVRLVYSDGHDSGLYSWDYLYELCQDQDANWQGYLMQMEAAGASRE